MGSTEDEQQARFAARLQALATATDVQCGFCEKYRNEVKQLIVGLLPGVAICDSCVMNAVEIVEMASRA